MAGRKGKLGDDVDTLNDHFRVYFPSAETIKKCRGGKDVRFPGSSSRASTDSSK